MITSENVVYDDGDTAAVAYSSTGVTSTVTYLDGGANDTTWSKSVETYTSTGVLTTVDWWNDANVRDERDVFDSAGRADSYQLFDAAGRVDEYATLNDLQQVTDHWYYSDNNAVIEHDNFIDDAAGHVDQINAYDGSNHLAAQFYYNDSDVQTADNWYYANGTLVPEAYEPDSSYDPSPFEYIPNDFDDYIP